MDDQGIKRVLSTFIKPRNGSVRIRLQDEKRQSSFAESQFLSLQEQKRSRVESGNRSSSAQNQPSLVKDQRISIELSFRLQERKRIRAAVARVESGMKPSLDPDPPPSRLRRTRRRNDSDDVGEEDSEESPEKKPVRAPIKNWAKGNLLGAGAFGKVRAHISRSI
jgi:hypothetical protein